MKARFSTWGLVKEKPRSMLDLYEFKLESADERAHFANTPRDDKPDSEVVGREFVAYNGRIYRCTGHHRCGYHMEPVDHGGEGRRHCISERAIGRTYHPVWTRGD